MTGRLNRRALILGAAAALAGAGPARAAVPSRIAIVDWALLETALALGIAPVGATELLLFRRIAVEPALPAATADLGLRGSVNFERVASLAPDLIYGSNYSAWANPFLSRIAPVRELVIYRRGENPYPKAEAALLAIADDLSVPERARLYLEETAAEWRALAGRAEQRAGRPLLVINLGDARHFRAFGADSLFGAAGEKLGFTNAWGPKTSYSATAPVSIEALADFPDALVAIVGPVPPEARRTLPESALWRAMPSVQAGRVATLDSVNPFGGLPAARRFARLLAAALDTMP